MAGSPRGYLSPYSLPFGSVSWIALSSSAAALAASLQAQQFALAAAQIAEVAETASFLCELGDLAHSSDSEQSESSSTSPQGGVVLSQRGGEEPPVWIIPESPPVPSNSPVTVPGVTATGRAVPRGSARNPVAFTYCFREPGGRFESYSSK